MVGSFNGADTYHCLQRHRAHQCIRLVWLVHNNQFVTNQVVHGRYIRLQYEALFILCGKALTEAQKFSIKFAVIGKWINIHWIN